MGKTNFLIFILISTLSIIALLKFATTVDIISDNNLQNPPITPSEIQIGAFTGVNPPNTEKIELLEAQMGQKIASIMWFQGWNAQNQPDFPVSQLNTILSKQPEKQSAVFHLTWEPAVKLKDIVNGAYDQYITDYAASIKNWGGDIRFRLAHEMIQDNHYDGKEFYSWQDQPEDYVNAFRHIHDIFTDKDVNNAKFVWCPNNYPFDINILKHYYPGKAYVDWLCMDGYNWSNSDGKPGWPEWLWFDDIFANIYHTFVNNSEIFGDKPIMIGEFASCEASPHELPGQNKAQWIKNAFERLASPDFGKIKAFHWFHINKECDWRINSSDEAQASFKAALQHKHFSAKP